MSIFLVDVTVLLINASDSSKLIATRLRSTRCMRRHDVLPDNMNLFVPHRYFGPWHKYGLLCQKPWLKCASYRLEKYEVFSQYIPKRSFNNSYRVIIWFKTYKTSISSYNFSDVYTV